MSAEAPEWMSWVWEWDEEELEIVARDPENEDCSVSVFEFKEDPGPELINMIMDSREVVMNIEQLIDRKIAEKKATVVDVKLVYRRGIDTMQAAIQRAVVPWLGQKLTKKKYKKMLERLFAELDKVVTVEAETAKVDAADAVDPQKE